MDGYTPRTGKEARMTTRRTMIKGTAATVGALAVAPGLLAQSAAVRVGYAISRTGPWTGGQVS